MEVCFFFKWGLATPNSIYRIFTRRNFSLVLPPALVAEFLSMNFFFDDYIEDMVFTALAKFVHKYFCNTNLGLCAQNFWAMLIGIRQHKWGVTVLYVTRRA